MYIVCVFCDICLSRVYIIILDYYVQYTRRTAREIVGVNSVAPTNDMLD